MKLTVNLHDPADVAAASKLLEQYLPKPMTDAPSSADVHPWPFAQEDTQANTSSVPTPPADTPPAPPSAPAASTAAPPSINPADVDSAGQLWDARIHASSRAKNKDGTWRARRNVETAEAPSTPTPPAPPPPQAFATADPTTFSELMTRFTVAVSAGKMPPTAPQEAIQANGLTSIIQLQQQPEYIPLVWACLAQRFAGI